MKTALTEARISMPLYTKLLLERLAVTASMDWYIHRTTRRRTISGPQATILATAFVRENFHAFDNGELFTIYNWYVKQDFDTTAMSKELVAYFSKE